MAEWNTLDAFWRLREDRTLSNADWRVAIALVMFVDKTGTCFPSVRKIATTARTSPGAVRRSIRRMETGVGPVGVSVERGRTSDHGDRESHRYLLHLREGWDHPDPTPGTPDPGVGSPRPQGGVPLIPGVGSPVPPKKTSEEDNEEDKEEVSASQSSAVPLTLSPVGPSKKEASRKSKPKAKIETPDPNVAVLRDFYVAEYERTKSAKPILTKRQWGQAMASVKELLVATRDLELAKSIIRRALADEWHRQNRCQPWEIVADANKFIGAQPAKRANGRAPIPQPNYDAPINAEVIEG